MRIRKNVRFDLAVAASTAMVLGSACGPGDDALPNGSSGSTTLSSSSTASSSGGASSAGGASSIGSGGANVGGSAGPSGGAGGGGAGSQPDGGDTAVDGRALESSVEAEASTGSPRDASVAADGASTDAPGSGTCVTAGTELCEDFETGQLDLQKWKVVKPTASAAIDVDDTRPHRGKYSLHVKLVPGQSSTAQIADAVTFPAASNTFYTRAFVYFAPDLPADNNGGFHMAYLLATGNNDLGFVEAGLGSAGNKNYLGYSEYYGSGPNNHAHGPTFTEFGPRSQLQVAPMKWICLELMQGGDATTTMRRIWVDGNELTEQRSNFSDRKPPKFDLVSIGVLQYHPTTILSDAWFDDIRVSARPIGCDL